MIKLLCVLAALLRLCRCADSECVRVCFLAKDMNNGNIVSGAVKTYSRRCAVFDASMRLSRAVQSYSSGMLDASQSSDVHLVEVACMMTTTGMEIDLDPQVEMACMMAAFDTVVALFDKRPLVNELSLSDVAYILCLADFLVIDESREEEFYRDLARVNIKANEPLDEKTKRRCSALESMRKYMVQLHKRLESKGVVHVKDSAATLSLPRAVDEQTWSLLEFMMGMVQIDEVHVTKCLDARTTKLVSTVEGLEKLCIDCSILEESLVHLQELKGLRKLRVGNVTLYNNNMRVIGSLSELEELDISCWKIPVGSLAYLQGLKGLRKLWLRIGGVTLDDNDMREIRSLCELEELDIDCSIPKGSLVHLQELKGLKKLKLRVGYHCTLDDNDMRVIGSLSGLKELDINCWWILEGSLVHLEGLKGLKKLKLWIGEGTLDDNDMRGIGSLCELEELVIHYRIPEGSLIHLQELKSLKRLRVGKDILDDNEMRVMGCLGKLEELYIYCWWITEGSLIHLEELKCLRKLRVSGSTLDENNMRVIGGLSRLKELEIHCWWMPVGSLALLEGLKGLRKLKLRVDEGVLDNNDMRVVGSLCELEELNIKCEISEGSLVSIRGLENLRVLGLVESALCCVNEEDQSVLEELRSKGILSID